jgi:hypothetical protein
MSLSEVTDVGLAVSVRLFTNINPFLIQRGRVAVHEDLLGKSFRSVLLLLISNTQETLAMFAHCKSSYFSSVKTCYDSYYHSATVRRFGFFFLLAAHTRQFGILNFLCKCLSQTLIVNFNISGKGEKCFPEINAPGKNTTTMESSAISSPNFPLKELLKIMYYRKHKKLFYDLCIYVGI